MEEKDNKKNIVILGVGFGGLKAAKVIGRALKYNKGLREAYELVLVDRNAYHTYTPTLYEIATTSEVTASNANLQEIVTFPLKEVCREFQYTFVEGEIVSLDIIRKTLRLKKVDGGGEINLPFAFCIIALGSTVNTFGVPGVPEHALYLKSFKEAVQIRDVVLKKFKKKPDNLSVVIGGGGSTGIEIAGEIQEWLCELKEEVAEHKSCATYTTIIEVAPRLLPTLNSKVAAYVTSRLKKLGVTVILSDRITKVTSDHVELRSRRSLPYDVFIWTGGVKTPKVLEHLPVKSDSKCAIITDDFMKVSNGVYGIGDSVCTFDAESGKPVPAVARVAITQGKIAALNILEDACMALFNIRKARYRVYKLWNYPYVVPAGGKWAAAKIGPLIFTGFLGWIFKGLVELTYFLSIMPASLAIKIWIKGLLIFIKNDRLG